MERRFVSVALGLLLLLLAAACAPLTSTPAATTPHPSPTPSPSALVTDNLLYVRMTSLKVMWAETSSRVLRSTDRGSHWSEVTPTPHGDSGSFFALDDQTAWFATNISEGGGSDIYRTTDGGQTWARSGAAFRISGPHSLDFVDAFHGWATVNLGAALGSESVTILQSFDGGASWKKIADTGDPTTPGGSPGASGLAFGCDKTPAVFGSSTVGVLPVQCAGGPPYVYRTHDGGQHWSTVNLPSRGEGSYFANAQFLTSTDIVLPGNYYIGGPNPTPVLAFSHDAGVTWQAVTLPGVGSVDFASPSYGWQLVNPLQSTADGGKTWRAMSVPAPPFNTLDMTLQDLGGGVAIAWNTGAVWRTDDSAATWSKVTPPQKAS